MVYLRSEYIDDDYDYIMNYYEDIAKKTKARKIINVIEQEQITDTGIGMSKTTIEKIFTTFFTTKTTSQRHFSRMETYSLHLRGHFLQAILLLRRLF